jgi:hypothetical protein
MIKYLNFLPQITYLMIVFLNLLLSAHLHDKPRSNENFWITLIANVILSLLIYSGGFFDIFFKH